MVLRLVYQYRKGVLHSHPSLGHAMQKLKRSFVQIQCGPYEQSIEDTKHMIRTQELDEQVK